MPTKEELLQELAKLGVDTSKKIRKPRNDQGLPRGDYKPRSDKGKARGSYTSTAVKYKSVFEKMLASHKASNSGDGTDNLIRDSNMIFPPNLNKYVRKYSGKDRDYYYDTTKPSHLEQARWRWFMAEYAENPVNWRSVIADWYFIREDEVDTWTYFEWAWSYVNEIAGAENRLIDNPVILEYSKYIGGAYNGHPTFDNQGEIIW